LDEEPPTKIARFTTEGSARHTLRGLAPGCVRLRESNGGKACVVFGDTFPCWLPVLEELGLRAVMVMLKDDAMLDAVEAILDDACVVVVGKK
jgi:hypothetical protein